MLKLEDIFKYFGVEDSSYENFDISGRFNKLLEVLRTKSFTEKKLKKSLEITTNSFLKEELDSERNLKDVEVP